MQYLLGLFRHALACPVFSKITQCLYPWEGLSYFVYLLHVITHLWKVQRYHAILFGYGPACPKFPEINCQYLWKGFSNFVDFLDVIICILLGIHWSCNNILFWVGTVMHRLSASHIVRCFQLKNLKNYMTYQIDFLLPLKLQKKQCYFWLWSQKSLRKFGSLQDFLLLTCLTC